ncbi:acyl-CoA dehydrogenase family protein [Rhodococcus koreensis]
MTTVTQVTVGVSNFPAAARALAPILEAESEASLKAGSATPTAVESLRSAGMFGLIVPAEFGGAELGLAEWSKTISELSYGDGSLGWTALANSTVAGIASRWLSYDVAKGMFADKSPALAGQFTPRGSAVREQSKFWVAGKYSFGSGSNHADWIGGGAMERQANGDPVIRPDGTPSTIGFFLPRSNIEFAGNWDVMGLQATGSFDYVVSEQLVEEGYTFFQHEAAKRGRGAASYTTGVTGVAGHAGWALGVAKRALDEVLKSAPTPQTRLTGPNAEREGFLHDIAKLDASLRAAGTLVSEVFDDLDAAADRGEPFTPAMLARCFQATTYATRVSLTVVRECFEWAGVAAIRAGAMRRCYLDMSVAALHLSQTRESFIGMGRELVATAASEH